MICGIKNCSYESDDKYRRLCKTHEKLYWRWYQGWGGPVVRANCQLYSIDEDCTSMYSVAMWADIYEYFTFGMA
jgi:hypothetical protein